jgi:hypothetical protein
MRERDERVRDERREGAMAKQFEECDDCIDGVAGTVGRKLSLWEMISLSNILGAL